MSVQRKFVVKPVIIVFKTLTKQCHVQSCYILTFLFYNTAVDPRGVGRDSQTKRRGWSSYFVGVKIAVLPGSSQLVSLRVLKLKNMTRDALCKNQYLCRRKTVQATHTKQETWYMYLLVCLFFQNLRRAPGARVSRMSKKRLLFAMMKYSLCAIQNNKLSLSRFHCVCLAVQICQEFIDTSSLTQASGLQLTSFR